MYKQSEVTDLLEPEKRILLDLLKRVGYKRTGTEIFEAFWPIFPMNPSEQALVRDRKGIKEVLMWRRKDAHYEGWHMVGGYILRDESDDEWAGRIFKKETALTLKKFFPIRRFNTRPVTGWVPNHQLATFFLCQVEGEPSVGQFFPIFPNPEIPEDTLGHHKKYLDCLRAHFLRMETMRERGIRYDYFNKAPEWKWMMVTLDVEDGWVTEVHDSLDDAVRYTRRNQIPSEKQVRGMFRNAILLDDQGLQIL